jgi:fructokinase
MMKPDGTDPVAHSGGVSLSEAAPTDLRARPMIVGEVLFDRFPDGSSRLGGAPFNVAWHLEALGFSPLLITRVGTDPLGDRIVREMTDWGLDVRGVQRDTRHPTGQVQVRLDDGEPSFLIAVDQAYDHLEEAIDLQDLVGGRAALLYHGTLISRTEPSRLAVEELRSRSAAPVFLDVNLRSPWWSESAVKQSLFGARWVKLNLAELRLLSGPADAGPLDDGVAAQRFRDTYALEAVIVTRGAAGALLVLQDRVLDRQPPLVVRPVDTVGAGDAFSAVFVAGLIAGWEPEVSLGRALDLAALICTVRGAVSHDRDLYRRVLEEWGEAS